jgi:hypothetical protein
MCFKKKTYLWSDRFQSLKYLKNHSCSMKKGKKFSSILQGFLLLRTDRITEWFLLNNTQCIYGKYSL